MGCIKKEHRRVCIHETKFPTSESRASSNLTQEIGVPTWKWEEINMDFIVGLPQTRRQNDSIWVIVDKLKKSSHFRPLKSSYMAENYARIYIDEIVSLHGIHFSIVWN